MKNVDKILEIEALTENLTKHIAKNNLLKIKVLYFIREYENLSVGMIIDKLGLKKSNFALMTKQLEDDGLIASKQGEIDKRCKLLQLTKKGEGELLAFLEGVQNSFSVCPPEVEHSLVVLSDYLNKQI